MTLSLALKAPLIFEGCFEVYVQSKFYYFISPMNLTDYLRIFHINNGEPPYSRRKPRRVHGET